MSNGLTLRIGAPARPSQMNDVPGVVDPFAIVVCDFVARARNAVELVEALVRRLALALRRVAAQVPLAEERPSRSRSDFSASAIVTSQSVMPVPCVAPGADRVAARQQRRARDRARELDVEVVQPQAFGGHLVDARRQRPAHAAVDANLAPAEVVREHQDDIGTRGLTTERDAREQHTQRDSAQSSHVVFLVGCCES